MTRRKRAAERGQQKKGFAMTGLQAKRLRTRLGLNQTEFWQRVGVGQSGGCRYEKGRRIAKPVQMLLAIAYGTDEQKAKALARLAAAFTLKPRKVRPLRWVCGGVIG